MLSCKIPLLVLSLLGTGTFSSAQAPAPRIAELEATLSHNGMDAAALKELGELAFAKAAAGDQPSVAQALEIYISLMQLEPANANHVCRYGSLSAMKGRDAALPMARMWYVQKGLEAMGKAVAMAPNDPGIRLTRASTCSALPPQFKQLETAIQDCQHLDHMMIQAPQAFPRPFVFQTRLLLASCLKKADRNEEARNILEKMRVEAKGTPFAAQAEELLK